MTAKKTAAKTDAPKSDAFPAPTKDEIIEAREQGVKDAIQESTKDAYMRGADQGYGDNGTPQKSDAWAGPRDIVHLVDVLDMTPAELEKRIAGDTEPKSDALTMAQVAGLLEAERSGKNRDDIVKLLCKHLGVDHPSEVTTAGPAYTNVVNRI
jgi:hypothetical protein